MKRAAVLATLLLAASAHADAFDHIGDGAAVYVSARPVALIGALQRIGFDQLPSVQRLKRQLGGIDPFNPAILAAPGIDVAAPLVMSGFDSAGSNQTHVRVVATLRDPAVFSTFIDAVAASGQVKLQKVDTASALGRAGVVATGFLSPSTSMVVRVRDAEAIIDIVGNDAGKKPPAPATLPGRFPLKPARPFSVAHGARRLFAPDAAAVLYVDGRHLLPLLRATDPAARDKRCAVWTHAPATFDDVAIALGATPEGLSLTWAWGTQGGTPLGGLKMHAVDDAGLDAELLGHDATAVVALYAASLAPFAALRHGAPFNSSDALSTAIDGCPNVGGLMLGVRSWPLAIAAMTAGKKSDATSPLGAAMNSFGALRTVVVALRDVTQAGPRGAVTATFDGAARQMLELLLAASGAQGAVTTIGKRSPTVYPLQLPGYPNQLAAALEALAGGKLGFTVADSDESLKWAFRAAEMPTSAPDDAHAKPPLMRIAADMAAVAKLGPLLNVSRSTQQWLDILAHLRHVDGDLVADGDLFRLTVHAPLKQ